MTERARWVLEDCKYAAKELRENKSANTWRVRWITVISLLRAVGHVLYKVDSTSRQENEQAINNWWRMVKKNKEDNNIFWEFINNERNLLLKEYKTTAFFTEITKSNWHTKEVITTINSTFDEGFYKDRLTFEVVDEAIDWWENQLISIEADSKNLSLH